MESKNSRAIVERKEYAAVRFQDYLDAQLALMQRHMTGRQKPADPIAFVASHELVPLENGRLSIRKRDTPLDITFDDEGVAHAANLSYGATYANRMGFQQAFRRGKYNDADRLGGNDYGTMEIGEARSAAAPF